MAKPNYAFEKRQRDLAKQRKKQEKLLKKTAGKDKPEDPADAGAPPPAPSESTDAG